MIDYNDEKVWNLFKEGRTKGIFQLESNLGRAWSKRLMPENLEELAALIAIIRPGTLKAVTDGKSMTQHFVDRKHGREDVVYLHDSLEMILKPTYGVLIYQEQSMRIAQELAGFNLQEADVLRKAIGKKKADLMAEVKKDFIIGCENKKIVNKDTAEEIFGWIEKSSRYSFNKSHAVAYAANSYKSAWYKANHTKKFFLSYLTFAQEKQDPHQEIYELISEAKLFDINVKTPNLAFFSDTFSINDDTITFGLKDIKSLTGVNGEKLLEAIYSAAAELGKSPDKFTWMEVLIYISSKINATVFKTLCSVGFFSTRSTGVTRNRALYEYLIFKNLTKAESTWITNSYAANRWNTLKDSFVALAPTKKNGGGTSKIDRQQHVENEIYFLDNPPYDLSDHPDWIIDQETKYLGCPISLSKVDTVDTSLSNITCKEIMSCHPRKGVCIVANIKKVVDHRVKKGKSKGELMSFLVLEDDTCSIDNVVVFPKVRSEHKFLIEEGVNLMFCGEISKDNSFIVEKIHEII